MIIAMQKTKRREEARASIDDWANEYQKDLNGAWIRGAFSAMLLLMENNAPRLLDIDRLNQYERLVELACEYLCDYPEEKKIQELCARVDGDAKDFEFQCRLEGTNRFQQSYIDKCAEIMKRCKEMIGLSVN